MTASENTLREQVDAIVAKHTPEWKAGHNHLVSEQVMQAVKAELGAAIGKDEPQIMQGKELEKDALVNIDFDKDDPMEIMVYCQTNGRNMLRAELRNHFGIGEDV